MNNRKDTRTRGERNKSTENTVSRRERPSPPKRQSAHSVRSGRPDYSQQKDQPNEQTGMHGHPGARASQAASSMQGKPGRDKETVLEPTEQGELLAFLLTHLPGGRNHIKSILSRGQVSVNGKRTTKHDYPIRPGQKVVVSRTKAFEEEILQGVSILYEDKDLLVVEKEAGLLSIASEQEKQVTAYAMLTAYVRLTNPKARIFVVHRLDRDTSGVMLYAKNEETKNWLQENWDEAVVSRTYVALVEGAVRKPEDTITSWLKESKTLKMYSSPHPNDGQKAVTRYQLLKQGKDFSLLELELETGRKNQIRVHMEDIGHPIAGDKKYGSSLNPLGRLGLHAFAIAFKHPATEEIMRFESKIPRPFLRHTEQ